MYSYRNNRRKRSENGYKGHHEDSLIVGGWVVVFLCVDFFFNVWCFKFSFLKAKRCDIKTLPSIENI